MVLALALALWGGAARAEELAARELTLDECIGLALENNLDLKIERISRDISRREVDLAKGGYDPELSFSAKRSHEETTGESAGTAAGVAASARCRRTRAPVSMPSGQANAHMESTAQVSIASYWYS